MVRVDIETIVMAAGPVPSLIVLRERSSKSDSPAPLRSLSIQTGSFEAAAISRGIDSGRAERPITHDLLLDTVDALGAKLERIEIVRAEPPVFYATIVVLADGEERKIDARPSDAIALAVRSNAHVCGGRHHESPGHCFYPRRGSRRRAGVREVRRVRPYALPR